MCYEPIFKCVKYTTIYLFLFLQRNFGGYMVSSSVGNVNVNGVAVTHGRVWARNVTNVKT